MKKIGNLYELINDALNEGFSFLVAKDLEIVPLEEKLDELVDKYGEAIAEGLDYGRQQTDRSAVR